MKSWALEVKGRPRKFFRLVYFLRSTKKYLLILFHASAIKLKEASHLGLAGYFPREGAVSCPAGALFIFREPFLHIRINFLTGAMEEDIFSHRVRSDFVYLELVKYRLEGRTLWPLQMELVLVGQTSAQTDAILNTLQTLLPENAI